MTVLDFMNNNDKFLSEYFIANYHDITAGGLDINLVTGVEK